MIDEEEARLINEQDIRDAGGLPRRDVDQAFLEQRGMLSDNALTPELFAEKGAALADDVILADDDPGDFVLLINNKLI